MGENTALEYDEKLTVLREMLPVVRGRIPVLTGVAEYTTALACRYARDAERIGVDGLMVLPAMVYKADWCWRQGWVAGLVNAFPEENRALWDLATSGRWKEARELYRWYTPLLHLDTKIKLVQYIKLAMAECGLGSEMVRAPRLLLVGAEREQILQIIRQAIATRPTLPALAAR